MRSKTNNYTYSSSVSEKFSRRSNNKNNNFGLIFKDFWNKLNDYLGSTIFHPQYFAKRGEYKTVQQVKKLVKGKVFLDIGCGRQWYRNEIEPMVKQYYALDNPKFIPWYESKYKVDFKTEATNIPLKNASIDLVLMNLVIEHLEDINAALREVRRILKPQGNLIIFFVDHYPVHGELPIYQHFTPLGLQKVLQKNGFKTLKIKSFGNFWEAITVDFHVYLMDMVKKLLKRKWTFIFGLVILIALYPLMIIDNILALIIGRQTVGRDFHIGHITINTSMH